MNLEELLGDSNVKLGKAELNVVIASLLKIVEYVIEQELYKDKGLINEFYKNAKNTHDIETNNRLEILYLIIMKEKCFFINKYEVFPSIFNIML